jgi:intein/homing endonuclease
MENTKEYPQLRHAVRALLVVCDNAKTDDGKGFNKFDASFIRDKYKNIKWTYRDANAIYKVMQKYKGQLSRYGIDYSKIPIPMDDYKQYIVKKTTLKENYIYIEFKAPEGEWKKILGEVKAFPGREFTSEKIWRAPLNAYTVNKLRQMGFELDRGILDWEKENARELPEVKIENTELKPFPYQVEGLKMIERLNGRVLLADEPGCIDGEAIISINRGGITRKYKLKDAYIKFNNLETSKRHNWNKNIITNTRCMKENRIGLNQIKKIIYSGKKECLELKTESKTLRLTPDHKIFTPNGYIEIQKLKLGDAVLINGTNICPICGSDKDIITYPYAKFKGYCKSCMYKELRFNLNQFSHKRTKGNDGYIYLTGSDYHSHPRYSSSGLLEHIYIMEKYLGRYINITEEIHHINGIRDDNRLENLQLCTKSEHKKIHKTENHFKNFIHHSGSEVITVPKEEKIISIIPYGIIDTYDIVMEDPYRNFIANGVIVHNCGKTQQAIAYLKLHPELRPAIIIPPATLKITWLREAEKWGLEGKIKIIKGTQDIIRNEDIFIINYDVLSCYLDALVGINPKIIIADECFPEGTLIDTPTGKKNIKDLKTGDAVYNATGIGIIKDIFIKETQELIKLKLSNKKEIICTPNHPFFTTEGWVYANNCTNKNLLSRSDIFNILDIDSDLRISELKGQDDEEFNLPRMWKRISKKSDKKILLQKMCDYKYQQKRRCQKENFFKINKNISHKDLPRLWERIHNTYNKRFKKQAILRDILFSEMENESTGYNIKNEAKITVRKTFSDYKRYVQKTSRSGFKDFRTYETHGEEKSHVTTRSSTEIKGVLGEIWTPFKKDTTQRRKWQRVPSSTTHSLGSFRRAMENRIYFSNKNKKNRRLSQSLQIRYCKSFIKNMDRSRREQSFRQNYSNKRQEERNIHESIRVESIEIYKQKSNGEPTNCVTGNTRVYNLHISNHPSYYANGFLVHNCTAIKNPKANRTRATKYLTKGVDHIIMITGSPILSRPLELFVALNLLNPQMFPNYYRFAQEFCAPEHNGFGFQYKGASNVEKLHEILISSFMIRRLKKDVMEDLPEKLYTMIPFELDNRDEYDRAEKDIIDYIHETEGPENAHKATMAETLVKFEKLKQLSVKGKMRQVIEWVEDFLETDEKLILFATHHQTIDTLMDKFGTVGVKLDGRDSLKQKQEAVDKFQNDKTIKLFCGNIEAAGMGLTLTAASHVGFIEQSWVPAKMDQAIDRAHRIGQKADCVNVYYLLGLNTIDETMAEIIDQKRKVITAIMDGGSPDNESLLTLLIDKYKNKEV